MTPSVLSLRGYGVAFGEKVVLSSLNLEIQDKCVSVLLGPSGSGKSTLLRTLAGFNDANPNLRTWGQSRYAGQPLAQGEELPALVSQQAKLMMASVFENIVHDLPERQSLTPKQQRQLALRMLQAAGLEELISELDEPVINLELALQRHLAILRFLSASPRLLCVDEPTTGLSESESERLLGYIEEEASRRAILVVLHNQEQAKRLKGNTVLLAGGVIQAVASTEHFFSHPPNEVARVFVRTGTCCVPSPDADPETLDPSISPPTPLPEEATTYLSDSFGPRGFLWLKKGKLAGTPRPGIIHDLDYDLAILKRVGVTTLLSLTERPPDVAEMEAHGLKNIWSPVPDMEAPSLTQASDICRKIDAALEKGEVIAVHCRAGLGRTGTILAAYLVWEGSSAFDALEEVRRIEPRWVQSDLQVNFLERFATVVESRLDKKATAPE